ncbi:MAG: hypothetical protein K2F99_05950 [Muribaculaceae bacterium]|nr:hypothetical protein [Muribaculaceae bacterium]
MEAYSQLQICCDLKYIREEDMQCLKQDFFQISSMLNSLRRSFQQRINITP